MVRAFLKKKYTEAKRDFHQSRVRGEAIKKTEKAALFEARKKEAVTFAQQKAKFERERRFKSIQSGGFMGAVGSFAKNQVAPRSIATVKRRVKVVPKLVPKTKTKKRKARVMVRRRVVVRKIQVAAPKGPSLNDLI